jgi:carboxyl-terminal processing protease
MTGGRGYLLAAALAGSVVVAGQDWRAAALASFDDVWQTVADTFYDPAFGGLDWNAVRAELRPKAEAAESPDAVRRAITDMLARLKRSHFVLLPAAASGEAVLPGSATVPIDVRITADAVVITAVERESTAARAGLRPGQSVIAIDGTPVASIVAAAEGNEPRLKHYDAWRRVFRVLHGAAGSVATLRVRDRGGAETTVSVARHDETGSPVMFGNLPPLHVRVNAYEVETPRHRPVGVIGFNIWMAVVDAQVAAAVDRFRHKAGLVIDLRGNPGGLAEMIRGIAGHLVADPVLLGTMQMRDARLEFRANPRRSTPDGRRVEPFAGPVAILVDELTASASECFAGALQSLGRARIFGRQTMGQALPASTKRLANGDVLMYALGDFVTSNGRPVEGRGVVPDQVVALDAGALDALAAGRDPVLEAAEAWLDGLPGRPLLSGASCCYPPMTFKNATSFRFQVTSGLR